MLLDQAMRDHLGALIVEGRSRHTVRNARSSLKELSGFLAAHGVENVEQMTHDVLMQFRFVLGSRLTAKGSRLAPGSQREHIASDVLPLAV